MTDRVLRLTHTRITALRNSFERTVVFGERPLIEVSAHVRNRSNATWEIPIEAFIFNERNVENLPRRFTLPTEPDNLAAFRTFARFLKPNDQISAILRTRNPHTLRGVQDPDETWLVLALVVNRMTTTGQQSHHFNIATFQVINQA